MQHNIFRLCALPHRHSISVRTEKIPSIVLTMPLILMNAPSAKTNIKLWAENVRIFALLRMVMYTQKKLVVLKHIMQLPIVQTV